MLSTRRQVLAAGLLPLLPRWPRQGARFGLVTYMWGAELGLTELLELLEATGLGGVELRTTHAHGVEPSLSRPARAEVRARVADSPVTLVGLGSDERFDAPDPVRVAEAVASTARFLRLSHDVGGTGVKVKPNDLHEQEGIPAARTLDQIGKSLRALGPIAADWGQELRVEVHGQCARLEHMAHILAAADHPAVRLCWNSNRTDLEGAGLRANFERVRGWFGDTLHTRRLDTQEYPVRDLFDLLAETRYEGWVLLEQGGRVPDDLLAALRTQRERFESLVGDE